MEKKRLCWSSFRTNIVIPSFWNVRKRRNKCSTLFKSNRHLYSLLSVNLEVESFAHKYLKRWNSGEKFMRIMREIMAEISALFFLFLPIFEPPTIFHSPKRAAQPVKNINFIWISARRLARLEKWNVYFRIICTRARASSRREKMETVERKNLCEQIYDLNINVKWFFLTFEKLKMARSVLLLVCSAEVTWERIKCLHR